MSAHTPGPWTTDEYDGVVGPDGKRITLAAGFATALSGISDRDKANRTLAIAAPELLAATQALWKVVNSLRPIGKFPGAVEALETASSAIAKATGGAS